VPIMRKRARRERAHPDELKPTKKEEWIKRWMCVDAPATTTKWLLTEKNAERLIAPNIWCAQTICAAQGRTELADPAPGFSNDRHSPDYSIIFEQPRIGRGIRGLNLWYNAR